MHFARKAGGRLVSSAASISCKQQTDKLNLTLDRCALRT
jgi:hypothetical protein